MGYALGMGTCYACKQPFAFNPNKVPSIRIDGVREPVCGHCMELVNKRREEMGLPPHTIHPDAYEAVDENEL